jgi:hypothetical protein
MKTTTIQVGEFKKKKQRQQISSTQTYRVLSLIPTKIGAACKCQR